MIGIDVSKFVHDLLYPCACSIFKLRNTARKMELYDLADHLREELGELGYGIKDGRDTSSLYKIRGCRWIYRG